MKLMTVVGTRPELIRLSRTIARADEVFEHVLVHTGQNYDYQLNGIFFDEMGIRQPDHFLEVDTASLGRVLGDTLIKTEAVLLEESPDALLVLGDTNSCIAALMAKRMHIPVYHMEAGNRSFDENVPEETNRRLVDHVADFNLVYTEHARRNLLAEGLPARRIALTGSPMKEVLDHHRPAIESSDVLSRLRLSPGRYFAASAHRQENVDSAERLHALLDCLVAVHERWGLPVVMSTHPRTRARLDSLGREVAGIVFHEPMGFIDFVRLQQQAFCVLSDSGTVSEESALLGFPAVTLRDSLERPEALELGSILMSGLDPQEVLTCTGLVTDRRGRGLGVPNDYLIDDTSVRAVNFILSTTGRHAFWAGLRTSG
jgi:UDP-N-acetylglucosamine 2-epimerase